MSVAWRPRGRRGAAWGEPSVSRRPGLLPGCPQEETIMIVANGDIVTPRGLVVAGFLVVDHGRVVKVGSHGEFREFPTEGHEVVDASGFTVAPGFVDIHVHGGGGHDVMEGSPEAITAVCAAHARHGTTSLAITTMTAPREDLVRTVQCVVEAWRRGTGAADIIGIHLEGPWINPAARGAHSAASIRKPDIAELGSLVDRSRGLVRMTTVAPELEGAREFIRVAVDMGVRVSLGHSLASFEEVRAAVRAGATHVTHAFNAMGAFHHREPGMIGAMLQADDLTTEAILDGFHLHPAVASVLYKCKGRDRLALVTDATMAADMPEGEYELGGRPVAYSRGAVRLGDGTLAGSALTLDRALRAAVEELGVPRLDAFVMASATPARIIGVYDRKGSIKEGKDADFVLVDESMQVRMTVVRGTIVYRA